MLHYNQNSKHNARRLRENMTDAEQALWSRLRRKQLLDIQFYRQKPIGKYIVDFYAPKARLVVEIDGSQHLSEPHMQRDHARDAYLMAQGLRVLRFDNLQVLREIDAVVTVIFRRIEKTLADRPPAKSPPAPLCQRGECPDEPTPFEETAWPHKP